MCFLQGFSKNRDLVRLTYVFLTRILKKSEPCKTHIGVSYETSPHQLARRGAKDTTRLSNKEHVCPLHDFSSSTPQAHEEERENGVLEVPLKSYYVTHAHTGTFLKRSSEGSEERRNGILRIRPSRNGRNVSRNRTGRSAKVSPSRPE